MGVCLSVLMGGGWLDGCVRDRLTKKMATENKWCACSLRSSPCVSLSRTWSFFLCFASESLLKSLASDLHTHTHTSENGNKCVRPCVSKKTHLHTQTMYKNQKMMLCANTVASMERKDRLADCRKNESKTKGDLDMH